MDDESERKTKLLAGKEAVYTQHVDAYYPRCLKYIDVCCIENESLVYCITKCIIIGFYCAFILNISRCSLINAKLCFSCLRIKRRKRRKAKRNLLNGRNRATPAEVNLHHSMISVQLYMFNQN